MAGNPLLALSVQTPDIAGNFAEGQQQATTQRTARLSALIDQFKLQQAQSTAAKQGQLEQLYRDNGPGIASGDENALGQLAKIDPNAAIETKGKLATQAASAATSAKSKYDLAREQVDFVGSQAQSILSAPAEFRPMLYTRAIAQAKAMGIDTSNAPSEYSDAAVKQLADQSIKAKDQIDQHQKDADLAQKNANAPFTAGPDGKPVANKAVQDYEIRKAGEPGRVAGANQLALEKQKEGDAATPPELAATDSASGSILAQTGLSMPAFLALTGHAAQLPRDKASRDAAFKQAEEFANKRGVDVSTLTSQYQAYNETLNSNIKRVNQTKIMEGEIQGTLDNLKPVSDAAGLGTLRIENIGKVFAGQETNDPIVEQYAFQLNQLRSELAAYNGALQGRSGQSLNIQDYAEAERVIKSGFSSKAADGLLKAVSAATEKMSGVLNKNVDTARKSVWDLFGVGANYKPQSGGGGGGAPKVIDFHALATGAAPGSAAGGVPQVPGAR